MNGALNQQINGNDNWCLTLFILVFWGSWFGNKRHSALKCRPLQPRHLRRLPGWWPQCGTGSIVLRRLRTWWGYLYRG